MSCSQCYTVQVPECIEFLYIYTSLIDVPDNMEIGIKIVNNHGNVYFTEGDYSDGRVKVDFKNEHLPKNLLNRYAGAMTIEILYMDVIQTMTICGKEYTCITLDVINNNLSLPEYSIGCPL